MSAALPLIHDYVADRVLLYWQGKAVAQGQFLAAAMRLARALPPDASHLLPLSDSRALFMLTLAAGLIRNKPLLLPSAGSAHAAAALLAAHPQAWAISDAAGAEGGQFLRLDAQALLADSEADAAPACPQIAAEQCAAIAHTSGSTGAPKPEAKTWGALVATSRHAAERFGRTAHIVATVPAQHMFGLEASVMLALVGSCVIDDGRPFFPADIRDALAALPSPRMLVTTPVHLRALVKAGLDWPSLGLVLSATAPLSTALAAEIEAQMKAPVFEIYGCTEAGSLATRRTTRDQRWRLYAGLSLQPSAEGHLLHLPYLPQPVLLGDALECVDAHHFRLLGRSTELLKVAGKRMSLADLTSRLLQLPGVDDAVVFLPDGEAETARPAALVVAPNRTPASLLADLAEQIDPVFLPRPLRCVARLPRNAVGKLARADLLSALQQASADANTEVQP